MISCARITISSCDRSCSSLPSNEGHCRRRECRHGRGLIRTIHLIATRTAEGCSPFEIGRSPKADATKSIIFSGN